jgi:TonB family protein
MAIPNQEVLVVFVLDKAGEVKRVKLVDSMGYKVLNKSCVEAVQMSKNFGKVPEELLEDGVLIIFFTFRYIVD